jgi:aubergine-like protein
VVGAIVLTDYNNNTYRVDDVDFSQNPTSTFELKSKDKISYLKYYAEVGYFTLFSSCI